MSHDYCIVLTTFENEEQALSVLEAVLEDKLAACIQIIPMHSLYVWEGITQRDAEVLVLLKTSGQCYRALETRLQDLHPYEVPEILRLDVQGGAQTYLEWIDAQTVQQI